MPTSCSTYTGTEAIIAANRLATPILLLRLLYVDSPFPTKMQKGMVVAVVVGGGMGYTIGAIPTIYSPTSYF